MILSIKNKIRKIDHNVFDILNQSYTVQRAKLVDFMAINPSFIYFFIFILTYIYYDNKYLSVFVYFFITGFIVVILKQWIKRTRPVPIKGKLWRELLNFDADNFSFPSAHSFMIFQIVPLTFMIFGYFGFIFLIYAIFTAFSRLYLRFHFLSDILVGSFFGTIFGIIGILLLG